MILATASALAQEACKGLEVMAISGYLDPIPGASFTFEDLFRKVSIHARTNSDGTGCLDLPSGRYMVRVVATGFASSLVAFDLDAVPAVLPVALRIGRLSDPISAVVRGQLKGFSNKNVWIVLSHILAQERYTQRLKPGGKFEFQGEFAGIYEIHAVADGEILAGATFEKTGATNGSP